MDLINHISDMFTSMGIQNTHCVEYGYDTFRDDTGRSICAYVLRSTDFHGLALIENFDIGSIYKSSEGKNSNYRIGFHVLQAIVEKLLLADIEKLELHMVHHEGLTFWPKYGAIPHYIYRLNRVIETVLNYADLEPDEINKLQLALEFSQDDPEGTWLDLTDSDSEMGVERETLKLLSEDLSKDDTMVINLNCSVVQDRLDINF
jgi:hypothetical protein